MIFACRAEPSRETANIRISSGKDARSAHEYVAETSQGPEEIARQRCESQVKRLYRHFQDLFIMHSKPAGPPKIDISDREIATYARNPREWRDRYLQGKPIIQESAKVDASQLDEAMFAAAQSSRRLTGYGQKMLLLGGCAWLSLKFLKP